MKDGDAAAGPHVALEPRKGPAGPGVKIVGRSSAKETRADRPRRTVRPRCFHRRRFELPSPPLRAPPSPKAAAAAVAVPIAVAVAASPTSPRY